MVVMLCKSKDLKKEHLASVRHALVGAAPLSPEVVKQFLQLLPPNVSMGQGGPPD